ncbi:hypothetical protein QZH41_016970 [Actinostola sp. cb2023]|nr:hypothetical protein QZH41_016970 [Actinostola sp. cb2023]
MEDPGRATLYLGYCGEHDFCTSQFSPGCIERSLVGKNHLNIPDSSFTASSYLYQDSDPSNKRYMPYNARLNEQWGWSPRDNDNSTDYLQIDLGAVRVITAVATQGNGGKTPGESPFKEWVKTYKLEFKKDDSSEWIEYQHVISIDKGRTYGFDSDNVIRYNLANPQTARYIRFVPVDYYNFKAMRVDVYVINQVPEVAPIIISHVKNSSTSIVLEWKLENPRLIHGPLTGYRITYTAQGGSTKKVDVGVVTTWTLTSLEKYTWYTVTMSVNNTKYVGPKSREVKIRTKEDGKRNSTVVGNEKLSCCIERSLVGKNHLNIPDNSFTASSRLYQDSNPSDKRYMPYNARLNGQWGWSPRDNDNSTDYLQIDLGAVQWSINSDTICPYNIPNTQMATYIRFVPKKYKNCKTMRVNVYVINQEAPRVTATPSELSILLHWTTTSCIRLKQSITGFIVNVTKKGVVKVGYVTSYNITGLQPYTDYEVQVKAAQYGLWSEKKTIQTTVAVPEVAPVIISRVKNTSTIIVLEWKKRHGEASQGRYITITKNPTFQRSNKMLESKLKTLRRQGKENIKHKPVIEVADLAKLQESPFLSHKTTSGLLRKVWFYVTLYWCRRGFEGQRSLKTKQF